MLEDLHAENIANAVRVTADLSRRRSLRIAYASTSGHTEYVVDALVGSWNRTARG
jgi:flavodoxin I